MSGKQITVMFFFLSSLPCCTACGILVYQTRLQTMPCSKAWSLNHFLTARVNQPASTSFFAYVYIYYFLYFLFFIFKFFMLISDSYFVSVVFLVFSRRRIKYKYYRHYALPYIKSNQKRNKITTLEKSEILSCRQLDVMRSKNLRSEYCKIIGALY